MLQVDYIEEDNVNFDEQANTHQPETIDSLMFEQSVCYVYLTIFIFIYNANVHDYDRF